MGWTDPTTWLARQKLTAALLNVQVRDNLKVLGDPMAAYTPTTSWGLGTGGTVVGAFSQAGKQVRGRVIITIGSSVPGTNGALTISLPVAANAGLVRMPVGVVTIWDNSAGTAFQEHAYLSSTTLLKCAAQNGDSVAGAAGSPASAPMIFATNDQVLVAFQYEAA